MKSKNLIRMRHAILMVKKTSRNYLLLSVTIVLSFTILLGYLLFTDSYLLNKYKEIFRISDKYVWVTDPELKTSRINSIIDQVSKVDQNMKYYTILEDYCNIFPYLANSQVNSNLMFLPSYVPRIYDNLTATNLMELEVEWFDRKQRSGIILDRDEAIIDKSLYEALGLNKEEFFKIPIKNKDRSIEAFLEVKVVGTVESDNDTLYLENNQLTGRPLICLSQQVLSELDINNLSLQRRIMFITENPEVVYNTATGLGFSSFSMYREQSKALEEIRAQKSTKATIAVALLILLGINLYSSFSNALNERKFEIGVKRAIGASKISIVQQFLLEGFTVMVLNIMFSIVLVSNIFILYKYIHEKMGGDTWIIYISKYSVGMFLVCSITLTVVFSLIFAIKSTEVEVVQYLKAE